MKRRSYRPCRLNARNRYGRLIFHVECAKLPPTWPPAYLNSCVYGGSGNSKKKAGESSIGRGAALLPCRFSRLLSVTNGPLCATLLLRGFSPRDHRRHTHTHTHNPFSSNGNIIKLAGFSVSLHIRRAVTTSAHANPQTLRKPLPYNKPYTSPLAYPARGSISALYYNFDSATAFTPVNYLSQHETRGPRNIARSYGKKPCIKL